MKKKFGDWLQLSEPILTLLYGLLMANGSCFLETNGLIATVPQMGTANPSSGDARGRWLSWSPDGSQILFQKSPFLLVNANGSSVKAMDAGPGAYATWSPDGSRIAALYLDSVNGVKLFTINSDGSDLRVLVRWDGRSNRLIAAQGQPAPAGFGRFEWTEVLQ